MEGRFQVRDGFLNLAQKNLTSLNGDDLESVRGGTIHLNLSHNSLTALEWLSGFHNLKSLILDYNTLSSMTSMPVLRNLETLSLVSN